MTHSFRFLRAVLTAAAILALTLAVGVPSRAQQIYGTITGTVRDASGATVELSLIHI